MEGALALATTGSDELGARVKVEADAPKEDWVSRVDKSWGTTGLSDVD